MSIRKTFDRTEEAHLNILIGRQRIINQNGVKNSINKDSPLYDHFHPFSKSFKEKSFFIRTMTSTSGENPNDSETPEAL